MHANLIKAVLPVVVFILGVTVALLSFTPQKVSAQTCGTPAQVPNVEVTYPSCVGDQCNFTQAGCSWGSVTEAANYQVSITETDTGTVVYNQTVPSTTSSVSVSITQGRTYQCNVAAVNSCGNVGPAGTHSLLCAADAGVTTSPTVAPTTPPAATTTPVPTMPPAGALTGIAVGGLSLILIFLGSLVFLL